MYQQIGDLTDGRAVKALVRHTGWEFAYGLNPDVFPGQLIGNATYRPQSELGCIDAPESLPGGAVVVEDFQRWRDVHERLVMR